MLLLVVACPSNFNTPMLTFTLHIGSNGIPALRGLGVLEAILAKINASGPNQPLFSFLSVIGDELIYDVSFKNATSEISSIFDSMLRKIQETWRLESISNTHQNLLLLLLVLIILLSLMLLDQRCSTHWCLSWTLESQNSISVAYRWDVLLLVVKLYILQIILLLRPTLSLVRMESKVSSATPL